MYKYAEKSIQARNVQTILKIQLIKTVRPGAIPANKLSAELSEKEA